MTSMLDVPKQQQIDKEMFTERYVPEELVHREQQKQEIGQEAQALLSEQKTPSNLLLYGPPGTGKTASAKKLFDDLEEKDVHTLYANCFGDNTTFQLLHDLVRQKKLVTRQGTATADLKHNLDQIVRAKPSVLVLDEVDQLNRKNQKIIYILASYIDALVIFISNNQEPFQKMDDRVKSRLTSLNKIEFSEYTDSEIEDILSTRMKSISSGKDVKEDVKSAASLAQGDARKGLNLLLKKLTGQKIDTDNKESEREDVNLNEHQKTLLDILKQHSGEIKAGQIQSRYREKIEEPVANRTLRRYLQTLAEEGLVEREGSKGGRTYKA